MNILVTGGAGFIASHIVDYLIAEGHTLAVVDNLSFGKREHVHHAASFYEMDILSPDLPDVFASFKPQVVIHHAAQIDVQTSLNQPLYDAKVNILGTIAVLEQCKKHGVQKIIYPSTAAVYGSPLYANVKEDHPLKPLSFYGLSKLTPEQYIEMFANLYNLDYTILRYSNAYGIRQKSNGEGGVVSIFIEHLLKGETPAIYGDGEQTRDFVYVKDIVTANAAALSRGNKGIFNISSNQPTTINELLREICEIFQVPVTCRHLPPRAGEIVHSRLNNEAARQQLGWQPVYTLQNGLRETCAYYMAKNT